MTHQAIINDDDIMWESFVYIKSRYKALRLIFIWLLLNSCACLLISCHRLPGYGMAEQVVLVGVDGLKEEDMKRVELPNLSRMLRQGSYTWKACGVEPAQRAPAWASILCGATPKQHSVDSDDWTITQRKFDPIEADIDNYFPNIFYLMHTKRHEGKCGMFYDWPRMINLVNLHHLDVFEPVKDLSFLPEKAKLFLQEEKPSVCLIYFGKAVEAKLKYGWQSHQYSLALQQLDRLLGELLDLISEKQLKHVYILLVSGYHGEGVAGASSSLETYPWLIWGDGVRENWHIQSKVYIYDTAAMMAHLLGLKRPQSWVGRPIMEVFSGQGAH